MWINLIIYTVIGALIGAFLGALKNNNFRKQFELIRIDLIIYALIGLLIGAFLGALKNNNFRKQFELMRIDLIIYALIGLLIGVLIGAFLGALKNNNFRKQFELIRIDLIIYALIGLLIGVLFKSLLGVLLGALLGVLIGLFLGALKNNNFRKQFELMQIDLIIYALIGSITGLTMVLIFKQNIVAIIMGMGLSGLLVVLALYIKSRYAVSELELPLVSIAIIIIIAFIMIMYQTKCNVIKTATMIVPIISGCGLCLSYLYNKIAQRRLQIHSEANWRPRLYDLMAKENITYNDLLYLTAFFNSHKDIDEEKTEQDKDIDIIIIEILRQIINDDSDKDNSNNKLNDDNKNKLNELLNKLYTRDKEEQDKENKNQENQSTTDYLLSNLINDNNLNLNTPIGDKNTILFKACISELLKADWTAQK